MNTQASIRRRYRRRLRSLCAQIAKLLEENADLYIRVQKHWGDIYVVVALDWKDFQALNRKKQKYIEKGVATFPASLHIPPTVQTVLLHDGIRPTTEGIGSFFIQDFLKPVLEGVSIKGILRKDNFSIIIKKS